MMNIAMWSGPRNLSTAMMYSFGARADCAVVDEPFYGAYLRATGADHPMGEAIKASMPMDGPAVAEYLSSPKLEPHFYQKHMTHHMVDGIPLDWMAEVRNVFLIRHPARVIASYAKKREAPTLRDIGFEDQLRLFRYVQNLGQQPIVIDATDIRAAPEVMLRKLCSEIDLAWDDAMLSWPAGGNAADGVWAAHWYGAVHQSTGFADPEGEIPLLGTEFDETLAAALDIYDELRDLAI